MSPSPGPPQQGAAGGQQQMPPTGPMQSLPAQAGAAGGQVDLAGVMQSYQQLQAAAQELAKGLPPLSPFLAQVLTQLGQAIPEVIMSAGGAGAQSPGGPPQMGGPAGGPAGGPPAGAPPAPPPMG